MNDYIPPEEKLLKLIRGEKRARPAPSPEQEPAVERKIATGKIDFAAPLKNQSLSLANISLGHSVIRKAIIVIISASFIYLIASYIYPLVSPKKVSFPDISGKTESLKFTPKEELKPYDFYLEAVRGRSIFGVVSSPGQGQGIAQAAANADLVKQINLVGIISGGNPQAIVEDKTTQKTYYVIKGQTVGEIQVEDIQADKIIISYKGQRFELYL